MGYREKYDEWLTSTYFDAETKAELKEIESNEKEIEDRFYKDLEFGTAGLRGVIGAGTNRMNIYTVRKATQGLANYIAGKGAQAQGVALHTIPDGCPRNLRMKQRSALRQTESRLMYLKVSDRLRSFHSR